MEVEEIENYEPSAEDIFEPAAERVGKITGWDSLDKTIFKPGLACVGCGPQIGLKLALQMTGAATVVCSKKCIPDMAKEITIIISDSPLAAASEISKSHPVLCYMDDETLKKSACSFGGSGNFISICWNNSHSLWRQMYAKKLPYVATASVGFIEDYISKLRKAKKIEGVRFIDLFAPCLMKKDFDYSDTVMLARAAVMTGIWPLFEIRKNEFLLTQRPELEPVEHFFDLQRTHASPEKKEKAGHMAEKNWDNLNKKKFWMAD